MATNIFMLYTMNMSDFFVPDFMLKIHATSYIILFFYCQELGTSRKPILRKFLMNFLKKQGKF